MGGTFSSIAKAVGSGGSVLGGVGDAMGDKNVMDPNEAKWGDLSGQEKTARVGGGVLNGLGKGVQTMQPRPQGGGGAPIQVTPAPPVQTGFDPNYLNAFRR